MPWIYSAKVDSIFILAPAFLVSALAFLLPKHLVEAAELSSWSWVALVLLVDVAHVYGTLFRTVFDPKEWRKFSSVTGLVVLGCWSFGVLLYLWGPEKFWRVLAYLAVFHFVRQQFGFMRFYSRREGKMGSPWWRACDGLVIYLGTGFPLLFWHLKGGREFNWFVSGDFFDLSDWPEPLCQAILIAGFSLLIFGIALYVWREVRSRKVVGFWNWPRITLALGTILSWHVGIVLFNSDLVFTLTNVVAHGLPYMALTWAYAKRGRIPLTLVRPLPFILIFLGILFGAAYFEEFFWDNLIWRDHRGVFPPIFNMVSDVTTLTWLVPFLALPQSVHYVLDGFVWKLAKAPA